MARIFKKDYQVNSVDDYTKNANNITVHPNSASNRLLIKSKIIKGFEYNIYTLAGQNVAFGRLNEQVNNVDISLLPPYVYILKVENELIKFIKLH